MSTTKDLELFSQLFDEKLKSIHVKIDAEFTVVNSELGQIKKQVTLTNSRVNHLEDDVTELKTEGLKHTVSCPSIKKIEALDTELMEYRLFKKYPKIGIGILAFTCFMFVATVFVAGKNINTIRKEGVVTQEQTIDNNNKILVNTQKLDSLSSKNN